MSGVVNHLAAAVHPDFCIRIARRSVSQYKMFDGIDTSRRRRRGESGGVSSAAQAQDVDADLGRLLGGCATGDAAALRRLYDAMAPSMLAVALRLLRHRPHAEDAVQEAFLQIWRNAARFDATRGSPRAWMIGIVRYRALDRIDAEGRYTDDSAMADSAAAEPVSIEDRGALGVCLGELPEAWRQTIVFSYVEGYSHSEIAARTATPLGTVKSWIARGLAALKTCLER